jgi:hypothetical protein
MFYLLGVLSILMLIFTIFNNLTIHLSLLAFMVGIMFYNFNFAMILFFSTIGISLVLFILNIFIGLLMFKIVTDNKIILDEENKELIKQIKQIDKKIKEIENDKD